MDQGHECHVVTLARCDDQDRPFEPVHVLQHPGRWNIGRLGRRVLGRTGLLDGSIAHWPALRRELRRRLVGLKPDVVHAQFGPMGVLAGPVTKEAGIPLLVTFHGYDISRLLRVSDWLRRYRKLFRTAAGFIGVSRHVCDRLMALGAPPQNVHLVHGGIRLEQFRYSDPAARYDGRDVQCAFVGRLVEKKGPLEVLEAFEMTASRLAASGIHLGLRMAGDGPLQDAVVQKIQAVRHGDVQLLGALPRARVVELLSTSHIYVQHSRTTADGDEEGQGISFVEASAVGLPIIATRHDGIPDVVLHEQTGFLVAEGDTKAMAEVLEVLSRDPGMWTRFGAAGRKHVEQHFDLERQVAALGQLYASVVSRTH